jgi:hypothetical protein
MVISCKKHIIRHQYIEDAWLNKCVIPHVFIIGDETIVSDYHYDSQSKILTIKCEDTYDHLSKKVKLGITSILALFKPDYIIKCDNDVYVNADRLNTYANICLFNGSLYHGRPMTKPKGFMSCWGVNKFSESKNKKSFIFDEAITYCVGPLYYLSAKACAIIIEHMDPNFCKFEDVNVGYTLNLHSITIDTIPDNDKYIYSNFVRDFLTGKHMAWHDISHHTYMDVWVEPVATGEYP